MERRYRGDKWARFYQSGMIGQLVTVLRFFPRRRVLIQWQGKPYLTFLWCLTKEK